MGYISYGGHPRGNKMAGRCKAQLTVLSSSGHRIDAILMGHQRISPELTSIYRRLSSNAYSQATETMSDVI